MSTQMITPARPIHIVYSRMVWPPGDGEAVTTDRASGRGLEESKDSGGQTPFSAAAFNGHETV